MQAPDNNGGMAWPVKDIEFRAAISSKRLNNYNLDGVSDREVLRRYIFNAAVATSLLPPLHAFEIALRNAIHNAMREKTQDEYWYKNENIIRSNQLLQVKFAETSLNRHGKPAVPDRVVAELTLGFWVGLFNQKYQNIIYYPLAKHIFPFAPRRKRGYRQMSRRMNKFLDLRNRISHHEPVWHWRNLTQLHSQLLNVIYWISPKLHILVAELDKFPSVYRMQALNYLRSIDKALQFTEAELAQFSKTQTNKPRK